MGLIVEAGIVAAFALGNTAWTKRDTQFPYLYVEKSIASDFFVSSMNSSRTNARQVDKFDPKTALWKISGGYKFKTDTEVFTFEIGHQSEHEAGSVDKLTESYNFASVKYRIEL